MSPFVRRELGIRRSRHAYLIRETLNRRGWTLSSLARDMGISTQTVSKVINGQSHSERVLDRLRDENVPEHLLHDPRRLERRMAKRFSAVRFPADDGGALPCNGVHI
ncbi:helix-turn-helix domain-containing protein [Desulfovibrio sp. OttesenSCG-928-I05]|nr:helix-turn-helix domain-containing protein [Desulfovibrio sp. OttesenSCG-928-I05]